MEYKASSISTEVHLPQTETPTVTMAWMNETQHRGVINTSSLSERVHTLRFVPRPNSQSRQTSRTPLISILVQLSKLKYLGQPSAKQEHEEREQQ